MDTHPERLFDEFGYGKLSVKTSVDEVLVCDLCGNDNGSMKDDSGRGVCFECIVKVAYGGNPSSWRTQGT